MKTVADVLEVRLYLERGMAFRVVAAVNESQLAILREIVNRWSHQAQQGIYPSEDDRAFHDALYLNVGNPVMSRILNIFWEVAHRAEEHSVLPHPRDPIKTFQAHTPILEALVARDGDALRCAIVTHYAGIYARLQV